MDNLLNINHSEFQRAVNLLFLKKENSSDLKEQKAPYDKYSEKMSDCYKNGKRNRLRRWDLWLWDLRR